MNKRFIVLAALVACVFSSNAKVKLPNLVSDGMVIQHSSDVRLWGCIQFPDFGIRCHPQTYEIGKMY